MVVEDWEVLIMSKCFYASFCGKFNRHCEDDCLRYLEFNYLVETSNLPKRLQGYYQFTIKQCKEIIKELDLKTLVAEGQIVYIWGGTGTGKTTLASQILLKYFDSCWFGNGLKRRGYFVTANNLMNTLRCFTNTEEIEGTRATAIGVDLLVIDDLGASKVSEFENVQLLNILDNRMMEGRGTIITGNIQPQDIEKIHGKRIYSRITKEISILGTDLRKKGVN